MSHTSGKPVGSRTKIDVLIPAIRKDLKTLPYVIKSVRRFVRHPIGNILIVAPYDPQIIALCHRMNCRFVNERRVLPISKKDIPYRNKRWDRSGWLLQQLLKFGGSRVCTQDYYLVIDADTVLIRPHVFHVNGKTVFYCRGWSHKEYFRAYKRLVGRTATSPRSFVTHYMLFNKSKLAQLKRTIQAKHQRSWYSAIIKKTNKHSPYCFSEFEMYGNFLRSTSPGKLILLSARNKSLHTNPSALSISRVKKLADKYRSLSFHKRKAYLR